jgi:hypothetical protein
VLAVSFLGLDAALLIVAALVGREPALFGWAAVFVLAAVGVVLLRRRYARRLRDIARAREALRAEVRSLRVSEKSRNGA